MKKDEKDEKGYAREFAEEISKMIAGNTASSSVSHVSAIPVMNLIRESSTNPDASRESFKKIKDMQKALSLEDYSVGSLQDLRGSLKNKGTVFVAGPNFDPSEKAISLIDYNDGIAAHELGHAKVNKILDINPVLKALGKASLGARGLGMIGSSIGGLYNNFASDDNKDSKDLVSQGALVLNAPTLMSETSASAIGGKALFDLTRKRGGGFFESLGKSLKPFIGLPTYAAMASAPLVIQTTRENLDDFFKKD